MLTIYTCHWMYLCNFPSIMCSSVPLNSCSSRRPAEFNIHPRGIPLELQKLFTVRGLPRHTGTRMSKSSPVILFQSFQFYKGQKKTLHIAWLGLFVCPTRPNVTAVPENPLLRISRFILYCSLPKPDFQTQ